MSLDYCALCTFFSSRYRTSSISRDLAVDWLTFIATLVQALAWPSTIVVGVLLLRRPLIQLLPQMRRLKYRDLEAEFGIEVQNIEARMREALPDRVLEAVPGSENSSAARLLDVSPTAAVLEAWRGIESAAKNLIERSHLSISYDGATPFKLIERVLASSHLMDQRKLRVFNDLRRFRNRVAHAESSEISRNDAAEYVRLAESLVADLNSRPAPNSTE